jgi:signal transduction histidine kinase
LTPSRVFETLPPLAPTNNSDDQDRWRQLLMMLEHEMRTPLAAALMQLNVVEHDMRVPDTLERAQRMLSGARRQIFGLSQVMRRVMEIQVHGRIVLYRELMDLGQLATDLVGRLRAASPTLWSRVQVLPAEGVTGWWDASAIEQILENLLTNALKFSKSAPVQLAIIATKGGARLEVRDHGVGIAPEDQSRIFGLFERAASAQSVSGNGIGLWMVRHLVQAHRGRIWLRSKKGVGTTFMVWLPRSEARKPRRAVLVGAASPSRSPAEGLQCHPPAP